jgi:hypothetical protein
VLIDLRLWTRCPLAFPPPWIEFRFLRHIRSTSLISHRALSLAAVLLVEIDRFALAYLQGFGSPFENTSVCLQFVGIHYVKGNYEHLSDTCIVSHN